MTLQVDGRAASYNEYVFGANPLWDVAQIEVFRTPQTTTQGRNAIAGAIFVRTADPESEWSGLGRAVVGSLAKRQLSAVVNAPLVRHRLALRVAGDLRRGRPSVNIGANALGADPRRDDYELMRLKLLARPGGGATRILATLVHNRGYAPQVERAEAPFERRQDPSATYGIFRTRVDSATIELASRVSGTLALSATLSVGNASIRRFAPARLGQARNHSRDWSLETLIDWQPVNGVKFHAGAHVLSVRLEQEIDLFAFNGIGRFQDRQRSGGLFGEAEWKPVPQLTLTAGLRRQRDQQNRFGTRLVDGYELVRFDRDNRAWLPRFTVALAPSNDLTVGALVQRAYNAGGGTLNFETGRTQEFGAEYLWNYEVFGRLSLAGGGVRASANLFRNDMRQAQRAQLRAFRQLTWAEILNLPKARAEGAEASIEWQRNPRLRLKSAVGLLRTKVLDAGAAFPQLTARNLQRSPLLTLTASAEWQPLRQLRVAGRLRHHAGYYSDDLNSPDRWVRSATTVDGDLSLEHGSTTFFAYGRNLFNRLQVTFLFSPNFATLAPPRELGFGIKRSF